MERTVVGAAAAAALGLAISVSCARIEDALVLDEDVVALSDRLRTAQKRIGALATSVEDLEGPLSKASTELGTTNRTFIARWVRGASTHLPLKSS